MNGTDPSKAGVGFLAGAGGKSKKLALVGYWVTSCLGIVALTGATPALKIAALAAGAITVAAYVVGQSAIDAAAVLTGRLFEENGKVDPEAFKANTDAFAAKVLAAPGAETKV